MVSLVLLEYILKTPAEPSWCPQKSLEAKQILPIIETNKSLPKQFCRSCWQPSGGTYELLAPKAANLAAWKWIGWFQEEYVWQYNKLSHLMKPRSSKAIWYLPDANHEHHELKKLDQFGKILQHLNIMLLYSCQRSKKGTTAVSWSIFNTFKSPNKHSLPIYRHLVQCDRIQNNITTTPPPIAPLCFRSTYKRYKFYICHEHLSEQKTEKSSTGQWCVFFRPKKRDGELPWFCGRIKCSPPVAISPTPFFFSICRPPLIHYHESPVTRNRWGQWTNPQSKKIPLKRSTCLKPTCRDLEPAKP